MAGEAGLGAHPFVRRGWELAETLVYAKRALAERLDALMRPSKDEVYNHFIGRPELFEPARRYKVAIFTVAYPERQSPQRGREMARELLEDFHRRALAHLAVEETRLAQRLAARRAKALEEAAQAPSESEGTQVTIAAVVADGPGSYDFYRVGRRTAIINLARDYQFPDIEMAAQEPDFGFLTELQPYHRLIRDLKPGEFSGIEMMDAEAAMVYLIEDETIAPEEYRDLRVYIAEELALRNKVLFLSIMLDQVDDGKGKIEFLF
jgi:hypothetical protein